MNFFLSLCYFLFDCFLFCITIERRVRFVFFSVAFKYNITACVGALLDEHSCCSFCFVLQRFFIPRFAHTSPLLGRRAMTLRWDGTPARAPWTRVRGDKRVAARLLEPHCGGRRTRCGFKTQRGLCAINKTQKAFPVNPLRSHVEPGASSR